jgi:hypothetical protein
MTFPSIKAKPRWSVPVEAINVDEIAALLIEVIVGMYTDGYDQGECDG